MTVLFCTLLILAGLIWTLTTGVHLATSLALTAIALALAVTVHILGIKRYKRNIQPEGFIIKNISPFHGFGAFGWMLVLMILLTAISLIPMPLGLLAILSPKAAELYRSTWELAGIDRGWGYLTAARETTSLALWTLLGFLGIYLSALRLGSTRRNTTLFMHALAVVGLALTAMLACKLAGYPISLGQSGPHALFHIGAPVNANHAAAVFTFLSICALGSCFTKRHKDLISRRLLWFFLYIAFGVAVILLKSRGALLAWILGQACFGIIAVAFRKQLKPAHIIALGAGTLAVFITVLAISASTVSEIRTELENTSISFEYADPLPEETIQKTGTMSKTQMYGDFLAMGADWGRAGTGRSAFIDIYPQYQSFPFSKTFRHAENEYWEILLEYGWFWGAICLILGAIGIFFYLKDYSRAKEERECMIGLLAAVIALLIQNVFDFNLRYWTVGLLFWGACGLLEARRNRWRYGKIDHDVSPISKRRKIEYITGASLTTAAIIVALTALPAAVNSQTSRAQNKAISDLSGGLISAEHLPEILDKPMTYRPYDQTVRSAVASAYIRTGSRADSQSAQAAAWTEAQKWLEASVKISPHNAMFALRLAKCDLALNDQKQASELFLKAAAEDPRLTSAAMYEMSALSDDYIGIPKKFAALRSLLQALLTRERVETAHALLLKDSQTSDPVHNTALTCLFFHHIGMDEACDAQIETLHDQPMSLQFLALKASVLTRNKQFDELIALYENAEQTLKSDPEYWRLRLHASVYYGEIKGDAWYKEQIPKLLQKYREYTGISSLYAFSGHVCDARYALNIHQYGHAIRSAKLALKVRPNQKEATAILKAATEAQKRH